jgi:hypothetical protein
LPFIRMTHDQQVIATAPPNYTKPQLSKIGTDRE